MKALTLHQPWASLVALGVKTIETRSWSTEHRGPLAIHAGKSNEFAGWKVGDWQVAQDGGQMLNVPHVPHIDTVELPLGAVVATCTLVDVVPMVGADGCVNTAKHLCIVNQSMLLHSRLDELWPDGETEHMVSDQLPYGDFRPGRFAWLLADIVPLDPPVPSPPGEWHRGLWTWEPVVA